MQMFLAPMRAYRASAGSAGRNSCSRRALVRPPEKSPVILPIPGTSKVDHIETNTHAAALNLDDSLMAELERLHQ